MSGFTELFPVASQPHQMLMESMTGIPMTDGMVFLAIHLGVFFAISVSCRSHIQRLRSEARHEKISRRRKRQGERKISFDARVLKTAIFPLLLSLFLYHIASEWIDSFPLLILTLVINGVLLFLPSLAAQGNKDGRNMSRLDSVLIGLGGAIGVIPGCSRIAGMISVGSLRGVDREYMLDMVFILSIPVLLVLLVLDIYSVFLARFALSFLDIVIYLLMASVSFLGAYLCCLSLRFLAAKTSFASFCYYSWGMALFSFILYLMI